MGIYKKLAEIRYKVARASNFDKYNRSDEFKKPFVQRVLKRIFETKHFAANGEEVNPVHETDLNIKAEYVLQNLALSAVEDGEFGNLISFEIIDGETGGAASVFLEDKHITVQIENNQTDYDTIIAALQGSSNISSLIEVALDGLGTDAATVADTVFLTGGL
jgi:hypothetical protein